MGVPLGIQKVIFLPAQPQEILFSTVDFLIIKLFREVSHAVSWHALLRLSFSKMPDAECRASSV